MEHSQKTANAETACTVRSIDPYRWPGANLFRNPFGELSRSERAELAIVDVSFVFNALADNADQNSASSELCFLPFRACQIIGECGRGKTSRLLRIQEVCARSSYVYLAEDGGCPPIADGTPVLVDEAQRLSRRVRNILFRSGVPLVLATHRDLSRPLRRAGYQVQTERVGLTLTPLRLTQILNRRLLASRRHRDRPVPLLNTAEASILIDRFGTNIRAIEHYLYEVVQSQVNQHGQMRFID